MRVKGGRVAKTQSNKAAADDAEKAVSRAVLKTENKIIDLDQRLGRIEKRVKNNERFARTFANSLTTQVVAIDAVTEAMRHALRNDVEVHEELAYAIKRYDQHKVRRWFSGFFGVLLWISSVAVAGIVGAFIYWLFSGK